MVFSFLRVQIKESAKYTARLSLRVRGSQVSSKRCASSIAHMQGQTKQRTEFVDTVCSICKCLVADRFI